MTSITSWNRLEPVSRSDDLQSSLQARLHDPLWLLARQWQFGEFQGEDCGSPVQASVEWTEAPIDFVRAGPPGPDAGHWHPYWDSEAKSYPLPLEALVEREPVEREGAATLKLRVELGLELLRILDESTLRSCGAELALRAPIENIAGDPLAAHASFACFRNLMNGRVPDGVTLLSRYQAQPALIETWFAALPAEDIASLHSAMNTWVAWCHRFFSEPFPGASAWVAERCGYEFCVSGTLPGETEGSMQRIVLSAPDYRGERLDWTAFSIMPTTEDARLLKSAISVDSKSVTLPPAPATFPGMPNSRLWEMEDASVDLGDIEAARDDLGRLLLIEFALVYGNDFFLLPIEPTIGKLCKLEPLAVTDSFGVPTTITPVSDPHWQMFKLASDPRFAKTASDNIFFLPPSLNQVIEGDSLEEILLLRDEMANLAWAVERSVAGPTGPVPRAEMAGGEIAAQQQRSAPAYRLASEPPKHWIPFLPRNIGTTINPRNVFALHVHQPSGRVPWGKLLAPYVRDGSIIRDEEIPREGALISRAYKYSRWVDGSIHLWIGRRKRVGKGEKSSGLRFDFLENEAP